MPIQTAMNHVDPSETSTDHKEIAAIGRRWEDFVGMRQADWRHQNTWMYNWKQNVSCNVVCPTLRRSMLLKMPSDKVKLRQDASPVAERHVSLFPRQAPTN